MLCRHPEARTCTTDSGNLQEVPRAPGQRGKAKVTSENVQDGGTRRTDVAWLTNPAQLSCRVPAARRLTYYRRALAPTLL